MTSFTNKIITDPDKPFENDYTKNLKKVAQRLTSVCESEAKLKPYIATLDAPYGLGKTTFIDMWGQQLLNEKKLAVKFDAWREDYLEFPLMSLILQLTNQLEDICPDITEIQDLKSVGKRLCKVFIPAVTKFGLNCVMDALKIRGSVQELMTDINDSYQESISKEFDEYHSKLQTLHDFKRLLKSVIADRVLFIFVDELDRCKPSYAVNVLEILKHIFDIDNLCCIISTNLDFLAKTIGNHYGYDRDEAKAYLERFYDVPFKLPNPQILSYIEYQVTNSSLSSNIQEILKWLMEAIQICCIGAEFSLRVIDKFLRDVRIFIEGNELATNNKVPSCYLPCVIFYIACKRIENKQKITIAFKENLYFKQLMIFFEASNSKAKLITAIEGFYGDVASLKNRNLTQDDIKALDIYRKIESEVIRDLYTNNPWIQSFGVPVSIAQLNYKNHFMRAINAIEFLDLIDLEAENET